MHTLMLSHLLWLLSAIIVHPAHAEGVLVRALHGSAIRANQAIQAVRQLHLQLGWGGLPAQRRGWAGRVMIVP